MQLQLNMLASKIYIFSLNPLSSHALCHYNRAVWETWDSAHGSCCGLMQAEADRRFEGEHASQGGVPVHGVTRAEDAPERHHRCAAFTQVQIST